MEYQAIARYIKISPRKVRLVADAVRDLSIDEAILALESLNNRAAEPLKKTIKSAVANATHNGNAQKANLTIKMINVTEGVRYKRYHYAGRGRVRPYVRRTSHINVIVEEKAPKMPKVEAKKEAVKKEDVKMKKTVNKKIAKGKEESA